MEFHLVGLSSDIREDDFEKGEGASTGCGYSDEKVGKTFSTFENMLKYLESTYGLSAKRSDYEEEGKTLEFSKLVANHSEAQNGGWFEATEAEQALWKKGKLKLYSEDYLIAWLKVA